MCAVQYSQYLVETLDPTPLFITNKYGMQNTLQEKQQPRTAHHELILEDLNIALLMLLIFYKGKDIYNSVALFIKLVQFQKLQMPAMQILCVAAYKPLILGLHKEQTSEIERKRLTLKAPPS